MTLSGFVPGLIGPYAPRVAAGRRSWSWAKLVGPMASTAGRVLRLAVVGARFAPSVGAGVAFVLAGFVLAPWVGWAVLGAVLLALDRRMSA